MKIWAEGRDNFKNGVTHSGSWRITEKTWHLQAGMLSTLSCGGSPVPQLKHRGIDFQSNMLGCHVASAFFMILKNALAYMDEGSATMVKKVNVWPWGRLNVGLDPTSTHGSSLGGFGGNPFSHNPASTICYVSLTLSKAANSFPTAHRNENHISLGFTFTVNSFGAKYLRTSPTDRILLCHWKDKARIENFPQCFLLYSALKRICQMCSLVVSWSYTSPELLTAVTRSHQNVLFL